MMTKRKCPQCGEPTTYEGNPDRPFCSERCRLIDLGNWADESYRVPSRTLSQDEAEKIIDLENFRKQQEER